MDGSETINARVGHSTKGMWRSTKTVGRSERQVSLHSSRHCLESRSMRIMNVHHRRKRCSNQYHIIIWTTPVGAARSHWDTIDLFLLQDGCLAIRKPMEVLRRLHSHISKATSRAIASRAVSFSSLSLLAFDRLIVNETTRVLPVLKRCFEPVRLPSLSHSLSHHHRSLGPPLPFGLPRPPFFPPHFLSGPPPNPFMMGPRFPMPMAGSHGMLSPIAHLMTNGSAGGSDANSFENVDSTNITPNSTSYDVQTNGSAASPRDDGKRVRSRASRSDRFPFRWTTNSNNQDEKTEEVAEKEN